jgi:acetyl esterase/lipase
VVGNSVGGNMAAVVAMMAKEQGAPHVRFQLLLWPVTDAAFDSGSYQSYPEGFFLSRNMMKWFWDNYTTDESKRVELHASPLRATPDQLAGLPPALIQVAEFDVLRDEGEAYGRKLNEAGVETTLVRYNGLIHDYGLLNPLSQVPAVKIALSQAAQALKTYLA